MTPLLKDSIVWEIISGIEDSFPEIKAIIAQLHCDAFLVGGYFRDGINGNIGRDIDIILACPSSLIEECLNDNFLNYTKNHFGGFKVLLSRDVDLWSIDDNWAFKEGVVPIGRNLLHSIAKGCFYNYDSLVLNLNTGKYDVYYYQEFIANNVLDLVNLNSDYILKNPSLYSNLFRAFYIQSLTNCSFSSRLSKYLSYLLEDIIGSDPEAISRILIKMREYCKYDPQRLLPMIQRWYINSFASRDVCCLPFENINSQLELQLELAF